MYSKPKIQRKALLPSTVTKRSLVEKAREKEDPPFRGDIYTYNGKANLKEKSDAFLFFCQLNFTVPIIFLSFETRD